MLPFGWRVSVDRVRNGMSTPSMSTKINGRATPANTLKPYCCSAERRDAWRAAPAPPLVEQHHPVDPGVEEPPPAGAGTRARSTMEHQRRLAQRVAARLPIDQVAVSDAKHAVGERFDLRIQSAHPGDPTPRPLAVHPLSTFADARASAADEETTALAPRDAIIQCTTFGRRVSRSSACDRPDHNAP